MRGIFSKLAGFFAGKSIGSDFALGLDLDGGGTSRLSEPYVQSAWISAAIAAAAGPVKAVSLKFYAGEQEYEDRALDAWWRQPAAGMSRAEWLDATLGWYKLAGEFFWLLGGDFGPGLRGRLAVASPRAMRHIVRGGELTGWIYTDVAGRQIPLLPEEVIHARRWNPLDAFRGLGEIEAARLAAETDWLAGRYARDTYANSGDQGDYITSKGGAVSDEQREQITAALRARRAAKIRGEYRPLFFSGDIDVKSPTVTAPDAAFVANRLQTRHEIFVALGVPPSMADVQASYSIGSASDYFRLIHGTSMPLAGVVADAITRVVRLQTGRDLEPYFDFDEHPTMQQVRGERIDAAQKLWGMGVPMKEINDYLDMGMKPYSGWDVGYLPFSVAPQGEGAEDPAGTAAAEVDPLEETKALFLTRSAAPAVHETGCPCCDAKGATSREWMAHWQSRQATIKTYKAKFDRHLMSARNAVLGRLGRGKKSAAVEFVFDLEEWEAGLQVEMGKAGRDALNKAGRGVFAEIGREDDAWTMPPAKALAYLQKRENFFTNIADSIHKQILGSLEEGFQAGETTDELATRIRAEFAGISKQRALRIAMTETSAAYGAARQEAISQSGIKFKRWLTSGNANVRPSHRAAEGQIVPKDEPFIIGGASVMHPGDGSLGAPAAEIINCHCVAVASETED